jgi:phage recombination protein Bet
MTDALALAPSPAPVVTRDQLELIKRTVAVGATDAELELFLFDCQRRGVHPLDRLIHFTKRGGRYTPITSIDFLRGRAHDTGEMAGSDDVQFDKDARTATVTVYRLTRGTRYAYSATARYGEYVPDPGPNGRGDVMWKRMPHVMLGKCAEALALRKAFPQQLGGLYVKEELEQARPDFVTEATAIADSYPAQQNVISAAQPLGSPQMAPAPRDTADSHERADRAETTDARDQIEVHEFPAARLARLATGVVLITKLDAVPTKNPNVIRTTLTLAGGPSWPANQTRVTTINERLAAHAEAAWHSEQAVRLVLTKGKFGYELASIEDAYERSLSPPDALPDREDPDSPFG